MSKMKYLLLPAGMLIFTACANPETSPSNNGDESQIVMEADSMSAELSASGEAVELKVTELETTLDSLENQ